MLVSLYLAIQLARALDVTAEWALQKYYTYIESRAQAAAAVFCYRGCCVSVVVAVGVAHTGRPASENPPPTAIKPKMNVTTASNNTKF